MAISARMAAVLAKVEATEQAHLADLRAKGKADKDRIMMAKVAATRRAARAVAARKAAEDRWIMEQAMAARVRDAKREKRSN